MFLFCGRATMLFSTMTALVYIQQTMASFRISLHPCQHVIIIFLITAICDGEFYVSICLGHST